MEIIKGKFVFSEEELELMKKMYLEDKLGCKEIGEYFNCKRGIIEKNLGKIGVQKRQNGCLGFSEDDIEEMKRLYIDEHLSFLKISKLYNCSRCAIQNTLKKSGIKPRNNKEKGNNFTCDNYFFETIDSEEKAYWLGFIFGDGWIETNRKHSSDMLGLALSESDESHIIKFQKSIKSNHLIHRYNYGKGAYSNNKKYSRLQIKSDKIVADLMKYGLIPNKTNKNFSPKDIPNNFLRHFIRGFFDADGSLPLRKVKQGYAVGSVSITKNPEMLGFIEKSTNLKWKHYYRKKDNPQCLTIYLYGKEQQMSFLDYIYEDATIYLDRKYDKYIEIKNTNNKYTER